MKYFVKFEFIDPGIMLPEHQMAEFIEKRVLPSLETLEKLETEKKTVMGGIPAGARAISMVVEAANHDELDKLLHELPLWGAAKVEVTPLQTFKNRYELDAKFAQKFKTSVR